MTYPYKHEPFTDFTCTNNKRQIEEALEKVTEELGQDYPLIIGGKRITTEEKITSVNPANHQEVIGVVSKANKDLAEEAMQIADETFEKHWRTSDPAMRADILFKAAAIIRKRK